jgi:aminopeptidase
MDPRVERMADVIVNYCVGVRPGQWVTLSTGTAGEPIAIACQAAILRAGGYPTIFLSSEELEVGFLNAAGDDQLAYISPLTRLMAEKVDVQIAVLAPSNTRARMSVDPARSAIRQKAVEPVMEIRMQRETEGTFKWTIAQFPTAAAAQDANMSLTEYEDFVYGACLINEPDPVGAWSALIARQQELIDWITPHDVVHITGPGTDLTLRVGGRTWINDEGKLNFPGGEIFTGPIEDATEGHIAFPFPGFLGGREVNGVCLTFKDGRVVDADATSGKDFLMAMLDMDEGARVLGEFAFGTNYGITRFTKNTLFDEKIGGTLHMALGRSIPMSGGTNVSALHWDMVFDLKEAEVTVDGEPFTVNGEFVV